MITTNMRLSITAIIFTLCLGSCCADVQCDLVYEATSFTGFTAQELDTVRVVIEDMEGVYATDTIFTGAVFYQGGGNKASLTNALPFNKRNSYTYYLPAIGKSYKIDGYEFSQESCDECFLSKPDNYHDVIRTYQVNGIRQEGRFFVIQK